MLKHLRLVTVQVTDQDRALDFYCGTLGFEKIEEAEMGPDARWLLVARPGAQTGIVLAKGYGPGSGGGFLGYVFEAEDIEETVAELTARGVAFPTPLHDEPFGRWAQFTDPDGNEFGVWAPLHSEVAAPR